MINIALGDCSLDNCSSLNKVGKKQKIKNSKVDVLFHCLAFDYPCVD